MIFQVPVEECGYKSVETCLPCRIRIIFKLKAIIKKEREVFNLYEIFDKCLKYL